ncbi:Chimeric ERCC6-PGBD3 protein [Eumeta japonica]|uniref:Chimeric ERCC6-PGBD3 protein n=1 Tax=Eumeta variegata TaxID=151549 RepID=A0A4C1YKI2_EUMVA|nr:Chimeric ERCC6-PGBD3 protein [Eumeta japonica]
MDDAAIEDLLNNSDWEFSEEDDDTEYLPLDAAAHELSMSEEESEVEQANVGEMQQSVLRVFWRTKEMNTRGPDITDDLLLPQDNSARRDNTDKLWKIRPIITKVQEKCYTLPRSKHLSIDEQMIPFSGRCEYRQYIPSKPNPLGLKNFVLAARDGVVLDFEIYVGSNTLPPQDMADLGLGARIVRNDEEVSVLKWKDTKAVTMLSTCIGGSPIGSCKRWCKVEKKKIDVAQPAVVKNYNTCMGGIDLCDRLIAYYRSLMRTRRWPVRAFSHFVDLAIVNCWIMYTRCCNHEGITAKDKLGLLQYRLNLATAMAKYDGGTVNPIYSRSNSRGGADTDSREIPSTSRNQDGPPKKKHRAIVAQPCPDDELKEKDIEFYLEQMEDGWLSKDEQDVQNSDEEKFQEACYSRELEGILHDESDNEEDEEGDVNGRHLIQEHMEMQEDPDSIPGAKDDIHTVGTVQQNRIPKSKLPEKKEFRRKSVARGSYEERFSSYDDIDLACVAWKDNKVVTLLSTYVGSLPAFEFSYTTGGGGSSSPLRTSIGPKEKEAQLLFLPQKTSEEMDLIIGQCGLCAPTRPTDGQYSGSRLSFTISFENVFHSCVQVEMQTRRIPRPALNFIFAFDGHARTGCIKRLRNTVTRPRSSVTECNVDIDIAVKSLSPLRLYTRLARLTAAWSARSNECPVNFVKRSSSKTRSFTRNG